MTNSKTGKKIGRPSSYSDELAARICAELACGKSLRTVCKPEGMPGLETIFRWLREKPEFRDQYAHAKNESADALVEEMLDIADDASGDHDDEGRFVSENVQRSKLRIDTRKWIAAKMKPKKFGDQIDVNHGGQNENPLTALIMSVQGNVLRPVPQHLLEADDD
jgi:hypothetical protein